MADFSWPDGDPERPIHLSADDASLLVTTLDGLDISAAAAAVVEDLNRQIRAAVFGDEE